MDNEATLKSELRDRLSADLTFARYMLGISPTLAAAERVEAAQKALEAFDGAPLPPPHSPKLPLGFFR